VTHVAYVTRHRAPVHASVRGRVWPDTWYHAACDATGVVAERPIFDVVVLPNVSFLLTISSIHFQFSFLARLIGPTHEVRAEQQRQRPKVHSASVLVIQHSTVPATMLRMGSILVVNFRASVRLSSVLLTCVFVWMLDSIVSLRWGGS
jgi:hypothetical protein